MNKNLKIIFAGTPAFSANILSGLIKSDLNIISVYTQPDRPAGRGKKLKASEVKVLANQHNIPVHQPASLKGNVDHLIEQKADLMIVVAYGLILPKKVLETPKHGCINVHASLLPRWRGAAPIQRSIEHGDDLTGITIMQMDEGLDTGDMLIAKSCQISSADTTDSLLNKLVPLSIQGLLEHISNIYNESVLAEKQDHEQATYAHKIHKSEAKIDWGSSSEQILRKIRAFNPWPICYCNIQEKNLRIHHAEETDIKSAALPGTMLIEQGSCYIATKDYLIELIDIQLAGSKIVKAKEIIKNKNKFFQNNLVLT